MYIYDRSGYRKSENAMVGLESPKPIYAAFLQHLFIGNNLIFIN